MTKDNKIIFATQVNSDRTSNTLFFNKETNLISGFKTLPESLEIDNLIWNQFDSQTGEKINQEAIIKIFNSQRKILNHYNHLFLENAIGESIDSGFEGAMSAQELVSKLELEKLADEVDKMTLPEIMEYCEDRGLKAFEGQKGGLIEKKLSNLSEKDKKKFFEDYITKLFTSN